MNQQTVCRTVVGAFGKFAIGLALIPALQPVQAQDISEAEKILFMSNHFETVAPPVTLRYDYVQQGADIPGFKDNVVIDVSKKGTDGPNVLSSRFLTDTRRVSVEDIERAEGNPALLGFLERDITEMKRLTGGSTSYFRKRIRMALAESAKIEPVTVTYKGQKVDGQKISIEPYRDDPMQARFLQYVGKQYTFILSKKVPGTIYQIKSVVPVTGKDAKPAEGGSTMVEETMTLAS